MLSSHFEIFYIIIQKAAFQIFIYFHTEIVKPAIFSSDIDIFHIQISDNDI